MNLDDRFDAYFADRADEIAVPSLGTTGIVARARRRKQLRTGVKVAAVLGVTAIGAGVLARSADRGDQQVSSANAAAPLDWTVVTPNAGLGASVSSAATADGAVYELSTEPGAPKAEKPGPRHLFRSTDQAEWEDVALPPGLSALDVAAGGARLYAVGTTPAGGGSERVELASGTGDGRWETADLPLDIPALDAAFPGKVRAETTQVATGSDETTLVAVGVSGILEVDHLDGLPQDLAEAWAAGTLLETADGIDILEDPCSSSSTTTTTVPGAGATPTSPPTTTAVGTRGPTGDGCDLPPDPQRVVRSYPWGELGVDPSVGALAVGRTYLYASEADGPFEEVAQIPSTLPWGMEITGTADGFWLSYPTNVESDELVDSTTVRWSADGRTWDPDATTEVEGDVLAAGAVGGRPALVTAGASTRAPALTILGPAGVVQTIDVRDALGDSGREAMGVDAAFGPMGIAIVLYPPPSEDAEGLTGGVVAYSTDGTAWTSQELPSPPDGQAMALGQDMVAVSADAVTVRLNSYDADAEPREGSMPEPEQRVLVGTR